MSRFIARLLLVIAVMSFTAGERIQTPSAMAQETTPPAPALLRAFSIDDVKQALRILGAVDDNMKVVEPKDESSGRVTPVLIFRMNDKVLLAAPFLCDVSSEMPGCVALMLFTLFEVSDKVTIDLVNGFNKKSPAASAILFEGQGTLIVRMLFSPGGLTSENIAHNILLFAEAPRMFENHVLAGQVAALNSRGGPALQVSAPVGGLLTRQPTSEQLTKLLGALRLQDIPIPKR